MKVKIFQMFINFKERIINWYQLILLLDKSADLEPILLPVETEDKDT